MMPSGYRRRILIEPRPGCVSAALEDDYHRMRVTLHHGGGVVDVVASEMQRSPWTLCPGAMAELEQTFAGQPLAAFARRGAKSRNCTHLHDLALFAAAHAEDAVPVAYEVLVTDPYDGVREAMLWRNGARLLHWTLAGDRFLAPASLAERTIAELGGWIAAQDRVFAEAGRILRWAAILAQGRAMTIPAGLAATAFPPGSCYNFQPERAPGSNRRNGADVDFSGGRNPLAERADAFGPVDAG